jgi:flavin-dependent dehydrogenase
VTQRRAGRRENADVLIVGGGPAGAVSALLLARRGLDVLLIDRDAFPRPKPCGECLSPAATLALRALGLLDAVEAAAPARLAGWRIVAPSGAAFEARFAEVTSDPLLHTSLSMARDRLDTLLFEAAAGAGVRAVCGVRVLELARDPPGVLGMGRAGRFEARGRLVIGADGLRSVVARRIGAHGRSGRLRKLSLTAHLAGIAEGADPLGEMHLADGMCAGIAPIVADATSHNVTLVVDGRRFGRDVATEPVAFYRRSLECFPGLRDRVRDATFLDDDSRRRTGPLLASGPFDRPTRHIVTPGFALVGDAAGYYDPFTGQGIFQALAGADVLAREAAAALERDGGPPLLLRYQDEQRKLVRGSRRLQRIIEMVTRRPRLADRAIARLALRPDARRALLAATGDLVPAFDALTPAVLLRFLAPRVPEALRP